MRMTKKNLSIALLALMTVFAISCSRETDLYDPNAANQNQAANQIPNMFDYSTVQHVDLTVDYSASQPLGPVFFSIYAQNPYVGEGVDEYIDESILPIFEDYTNDKGVYNKKIKLPDYAQHLYVVTGNISIYDRVMETDVQNGAAKAVAVGSREAMTRGAAITRGEQTSNLNNMTYLWKTVDENGNVKDSIYKKWLTPLGTWDSKSGRPNYLIQPGEVEDKLLCTQSEIDNMFATVCDALTETHACLDQYLHHPDLTLEKESEVSITVLGGSTCWNSTLGYYYYKDGEEPSNPNDLNIIMLFPNTQDGEWVPKKGKPANPNYNGNVGIQRGDAVLLKYYPHIAENGDLSEATTKFPVGTRIGFILKSNGWAMQGKSFAISNYNDSNRKYNVWNSSTDNASFCSPAPFGEAGTPPYQYCNPNGESRSARFKYVSSNKDEYAIVSFEDACNDQDYDDIIFALKPVNSFTPLPEIEDKSTTTYGVYSFEDLWPSKGDYDLNDVVVEVAHTKTMQSENKQEFKIYKETFSFYTAQNYVELTSGLAVRVNHQNTPSSVVMKKIAPGQEDAQPATFKQEGNIFYLTNDVKGELYSTYILEFTFDEGHTVESESSVECFIYRDEPDGTTWEVHVPFALPTEKVCMNYFYLDDDDCSDPDKGIYYVRPGNFPFAFYLDNVRLKTLDPILDRKNEQVSIDNVFDGYTKWVESGGTKNKDWYLYPKK